MGKKPSTLIPVASNKFEALETTEDAANETDESKRGLKRKLGANDAASSSTEVVAKNEPESDGKFKNSELEK